MLAQPIDEAPRFFTWFNMLFLAEAAPNTLTVPLLSCAIGYAAGFVLATARLPQMGPGLAVRGTAFLWTELLRRIPFLIVLMVAFFGFQFAGADASLHTTATTAVALRMSALAAENVRGGYLSVNPLQSDAARATNMGPRRALTRAGAAAGVAGDPAALDHAHGLDGQGDLAGRPDRVSGADFRSTDAQSARLIGADLLWLGADPLLHRLMGIRAPRPLRRAAVGR